MAPRYSPFLYARKERPYTMQTLTEQRQTNNVSPQSRTIVVVAMLLFALAGLISGFAVGAFTRPSQHIQTPGQSKVPTHPPTNRLTTPTPTPHIQNPFPLGAPKIEQVSYFEVADDNNTYTFSVQATDQSNGKTVSGNPIHEPGISCKLWLTKSNTEVSANMSLDQLKAVDNLSQPFPKEEVNALDLFDPSTPQTQICNAKRQTNWNYKVTTSVKPRSYFLVVLTDWSGVHWSWSWVAINMKK